MAYADYAFYTGTFIGIAIAEADFPRFAARASEIIDRLTFQRAAAIIEADTETTLITAIQMATCAVAEEYQKAEQRESGEAGAITSEREGQYSVSYVQNEDANLSADTRYSKAARLYLSHTKLMFAGLHEDERSDYAL
jgi:hypothetical protein